MSQLTKQRFKESSFSHSIRMARKSHYFGQDSKRTKSDKNEKLKAIIDPKKTLPEDLIQFFDRDLEFLGTCLSSCLETKQFDSKFLPLFSRVESSIADGSLFLKAPTSQPGDHNYENAVDTTNPKVAKSIAEDTKWLYEKSFFLAVDGEHVAALDRILFLSTYSKYLNHKQQDNSEALIRACELNSFAMVKLLVSYGFRLRSFHKERQKKLKHEPFPLFVRKLLEPSLSVMSGNGDEVNELHILRMMARPAYILSCYTAVATNDLDEENPENQFNACSCSTTTAKSTGLRRTADRLDPEANPNDEVDGRIGLNNLMAAQVSTDEHNFCPMHKSFKSSLNCKIHPECNDPIFRCFDLAKATSKLANKTPEYRTEYEAVANRCRDLSVQLLDQCANTDEVQTLLSESSGTTKYFRYHGFIKYPRLRLAMEHNHKEFVGHMYCQQMLRQEWHGGIPWLGKSIKYKFAYVMVLLICTPFFIAQWSFTQVGRDIQWLRKIPIPTEGETRGITLKERLQQGYLKYLRYCTTTKRVIDNPLNRFIIFSGYYLVYLFFIVMAIQEPIPKDSDKPNNPDEDHYKTFYYPGLFVYACAMLWQDFKIATTLRSVRTFFEKFWRAYDLIMHLCLSAALATRAIAVELDSKDCFDKGKANVGPSDLRNDDCSKVMVSKASSALLTLVATISLIRLVYWFLLHDKIGPVVINMSRAITDILTITITYVFVLFGIASGMVFLVAERNKYIEFTNNRQWHDKSGTLNANLTSIGYTKMMVTLLWGFFNPERPEFFGDDGHDDDAYASIGYALYAAYLLLIVVVLLNLLIAIMNATVQKIHDKKQLYWKFSRTSVWMEFFDDDLCSPPIPFSFVQVVWTTIFFTITSLGYLSQRIFRRNKRVNNEGTFKCEISDEKKEERIRHANLMLDITDRYVEKIRLASVMSIASSEEPNSNNIFPSSNSIPAISNSTYGFNRNLQRNDTTRC